SAHPFGTIFYAQDADRTYIYDNEILNKIQTTRVAKQHAIITDEASRDTIASCVLKKIPFSHSYTCKTSIENIKDFNGNTYQFALQDAPSTLIDTAKIKLFTTLNETALSQRIALFKETLNTIYN
ncbi:MAG: hypothetical protein U9Q12_03175, partial [Patescibacteria group bacterium]|nr:hypothetical protein [Patescibacteria group bacterium]